MSAVLEGKLHCFTIFATYFHVCDLGMTENDVSSKEKTSFWCINVIVSW